MQRGCRGWSTTSGMRFKVAQCITVMEPRIQVNYGILKMMPSTNILSDEFAQAAAVAGLRARQAALAAGHPVVFVDRFGRYVQELPDGRQFEIRLQRGVPRESHLHVVGELSTPVE